DEAAAGHLVAELQAGRRVRRAARLERRDGIEYRLAVATRRRLEDDAGVGAVRDDADGVVAAEHLDERAQRLLHELEAVLAGHRARRVDDEGQRGRRPGVVGDVAGLDADPAGGLGG